MGKNVKESSRKKVSVGHAGGFCVNGGGGEEGAIPPGRGSHV